MKLRIFNEFDIETIGNVALGLGGAAALGYGAKKIYDYYTEPSKEEKINDIMEGLNFIIQKTGNQQLNNILKEQGSNIAIKMLDYKELTEKNLAQVGFFNGNDELIKLNDFLSFNPFLTYKMKKFEGMVNDIIECSKGLPQINIIKNNSVINAFAMPDVDVSQKIITGESSLWFKLSSIPIIGLIPWTIKAGIDYFKKPEGNIYYNSSKNKIIIENDISKHLLIIYTGLANMVSADELFAIILHEIGHLNYVGNYIFLHISQTLGGMGILGIILTLFLMHKNIIIKDAIFTYKILGGCFLTFLATLYLSNFFLTRNEMRADDFAIKCGQGNNLRSGLLKMKAYQERMIKILKFLLKIQEKLGSPEAIMTKYKIESYEQQQRANKGNYYKDLDLRTSEISRKTENYTPATPDIPDDNERVSDIKI